VEVLPDELVPEGIDRGWLGADHTLSRQTAALPTDPRAEVLDDQFEVTTA